MPRRKITSTTQKKQAQKDKRAVKRGDLPAPTAKPARLPKRPGHPSREARPNTPPKADAAAAAARRLESRFLKPSPSFLALSSHVASNQRLLRPIPASAVILPVELIDPQGSSELSCPRRPKWRYDMSKKEVEKNEEGWFMKWRDGIDAKLSEWQAEGRKTSEVGLPRSPTYYERNLEVWRQLWRVSELSQILLILLDARCPPLHYPPSLRAYVRALRPARPIILVLTKVDVVGAERAQEWEEWLKKKYADNGVRVVQVENYQKRDDANRDGSRPHYDPHLPPTFRRALIDAMRDAYRELLTPPKHIVSDPEKVAKWRPQIKKDVDWGRLEEGVPHDASDWEQEKEVETEAQTAEPREANNEESDQDRHSSQDGSEEPMQRDDGTESRSDPLPNYLTIGLIGQPNVGKSSLLNALFGKIRVRASRTPGKTKHFQTLFLSPDIRLVDCPGLVMPNLVGMEMQVLAGILPISQIPSVPSCIYYAATLVPLEEILHLAPPSSVREQAELAGKRTWRPEQHADKEASQKENADWTAMQILESCAESKGFITAKAGRPDVNRAGNTLLRALAEARIPWGFLPPGSAHADIAGPGIWLGGDAHDIDEDEHESVDEEDTDGEDEDEDEDEEDTDTHSETEEEVVRGEVKVGGGLFAALAEADGEQNDTDDE